MSTFSKLNDAQRVFVVTRTTIYAGEFQVKIFSNWLNAAAQFDTWVNEDLQAYDTAESTSEDGVFDLDCPESGMIIHTEIQEKVVR